MNVAATTAAEGFPRRAFTVEDISRMIEAGIIGEDEKFELIEGEIFMMAAKGIAHEQIKSALLVAVARVLPDDLTMGVETTLRLTNTIMLEPDIAVFPKKLFRKSAAGFAQLDPGEARLVVEVAVSSLSYDKGLKARLYARHPVRELWVIDANERITWGHTTVSALPSFSIRLGEIE
jgi:Uma2 family endonuclease